MKQEIAEDFLRISLSSFSKWSPTFTKSEGMHQSLFAKVLEAPFNNNSFMLRVFPPRQAKITLRCKGVLLSISCLFGSAPQASK